MSALNILLKPFDVFDSYVMDSVKHLNITEDKVRLVSYFVTISIHYKAFKHPCSHYLQQTQNTKSSTVLQHILWNFLHSLPRTRVVFLHQHDHNSHLFNCTYTTKKYCTASNYYSLCSPIICAYIQTMGIYLCVFNSSIICLGRLIFQSFK